MSGPVMSGPAISGPVTHPVLACADLIDAALKDVTGVSVPFMPTPAKREALLRLTALTGQLEALRLRVIAVADDVATADGARNVTTWLAHHTRLDRPTTARSTRLAHALEESFPALAAGLAEGSVNLDQAHVIAHTLTTLPTDIPHHTRTTAETRLVTDAATFNPHDLRILGRRILDTIAPELGEHHEALTLAAEERAAHHHTTLTTHRRGDGSTDIRIRLPDPAADRLLTYLHAFTSPRRPTTTGATAAAGAARAGATTTRATPGAGTGTSTGATTGAGAGTGATTTGAGATGAASNGERLPHHQALGHAFTTLLETLDPHRLPLHGGDATTILITIDLDTLRQGLGTALTNTGTPITANQARRLACTAHLIPAVLGGTSEILDLGRGARLFNRHQRKALALRDHTCRAHGCDIPAAWTEAHHHQPWSHGGPTNLDNALLLCSYHHHQAHDDTYHHHRHPNGDLTFHRRT